ncbi:cell adhesion molecule 1-like [Syngnathoides biaculeatus]|uniref:cell adhesion molecule 1-like n=1 Tax=Syngnathoides biaculeatus TaxID=300417 RepID=UPI002ADE9225|nr:cell adhesion molecule 1-like [Syngnathoides biaculeatus]XP_061664022.1 cell adhesion molecule 1-like [Syngnathoides biaculeatus]
MAVYRTPPPLKTTLHPDLVTKPVDGVNMDGSTFTALIGGVIGVMLLILICVIALVLWCRSRHKGSYFTHEIDNQEDDDDDDDDDEDDDDDDHDDDDSVCSDTELQHKVPLEVTVHD